MAETKVTGNELGGTIPAGRQNNTTNTTPAGTRIETGWGFSVGSGTASSSKLVTFGTAFTTTPIVVLSTIGYKSGSDPTGPGDVTGDATNVGWPSSPTTTGFYATYSQATTYTSAVRIIYTRIAIGT